MRWFSAKFRGSSCHRMIREGPLPQTRTVEPWWGRDIWTSSRIWVQMVLAWALENEDDEDEYMHSIGRGQEMGPCPFPDRSLNAVMARRAHHGIRAAQWQISSYSDRQGHRQLVYLQVSTKEFINLKKAKSWIRPVLFFLSSYLTLYLLSVANRDR
jgi:hypothetical protein